MSAKKFEHVLLILEKTAPHGSGDMTPAEFRKARPFLELGRSLHQKGYGPTDEAMGILGAYRMGGMGCAYVAWEYANLMGGNTDPVVPDTARTLLRKWQYAGDEPLEEATYENVVWLNSVFPDEGKGVFGHGTPEGALLIFGCAVFGVCYAAVGSNKPILFDRAIWNRIYESKRDTGKLCRTSGQSSLDWCMVAFR